MKRITFKKWLALKLDWFAYTFNGWANWLHYYADKLDPPGSYKDQDWNPWVKGFETRFIILILALFTLPVGVAHADSLSVAVVDTQGNTETQSVNVDAEFTIGGDNGTRPNPTSTTQQEIKAGLLFGKTDGKRSSEYWYGSLKDRHNAGFISEAQWYWFGLYGVESDEFAGYDLRLSFNLGLGLHYAAPLSSRHEFKIEAGPGIIAEEHQVVVYGESHTIYDVYISARGWEEWTWHITDSLNLSEQIEYLYDYDDQDNYRINAEAGLTGRIVSGPIPISIKFGPKVRYVNKPPDGKKRTDIISAATIIFTF